MLQIYRQTKVLPPGNDRMGILLRYHSGIMTTTILSTAVTGQIERTSDEPVASGGDNDVYTGKLVLRSFQRSSEPQYAS